MMSSDLSPGKNVKTYLFYDIETTGLNKAFDQVIQFAAIRTDLAFNEIERYEYFVRLNEDVIPSPGAFITHKLPIAQLQNGLSEFEAIKKIHQLLNTPNTISIGYNSLGFDDEFLRFSFYRNLLPPYTHQYANNCQRMDLYPITVMYYLYKHELLKWPTNNLKLENINKENNFVSGAAHNAMVDVEATLKLAQCLSADQKTWQYITGFFDKQTDAQRIKQIEQTLTQNYLMIDGKFGAQQYYQAVVLPLGTHQHYRNQTLWLRLDCEKLLEANAENFVEHTFVINKKLGEPAFLLPMKDRFYKPYVLEKQSLINEALSWLNHNKQTLSNITQHFQHYLYPPVTRLDASASLYELGFLSQHDQLLCEQFHQASWHDRLLILNRFSHTFLQELAVRIVGRHDASLLPENALNIYQNHINSLQGGDDQLMFFDYKGQQRPTIKIALDEITSLEQQTLHMEQQIILQEIKEYTQALLSK